MKFKFVIVSKDEKFLFSEKDFDTFGNITTTFIKNNTDGLCKVYNQILAEERSNRQHDFICFLHADVKFDIKHLIEHCEEVVEKYDVIGLCGCEKVITSQSPLNWWTSSNPAPGFRWGCVTHGEDNYGKSFFSSDRYNIRDHAVGLIDGLCIIFGKNAIESDMKFDEKFLFGFYDTDISLQTLITYKMRLGVIVEESLCHFSVGKSILTDDFLHHEYVFRKKWNIPVPSGSKLENMIASGEIQDTL